jgi:hypothetical protein
MTTTMTMAIPMLMSTISAFHGLKSLKKLN